LTSQLFTKTRTFAYSNQRGLQFKGVCRC